MTRSEELLIEYLAKSGMPLAQTLWVVGSLQTAGEVPRMLDYITETRTTSQAELYSTALKILRETNPNLLEETKE
jgi:hypothetical protein